MRNRNTTILKNNFLKKCQEIHSNRYDYSLVDYKNNDTKIQIICPIHGVFEQVPHHHTKGAGCKKCQYENKKLNNDIFIERANKVHNNKYDYSLVNYTGSFNKVKIICSVHGEFNQKACDHINAKKGCPKCGGTVKLTTEEFILKSKNIHGNKYDYSEVDYTICTDKVKIICKKHGIFEQAPTRHLCGNGCPICRNSRGEMDIIKFLEEKKINYVFQKRFDDCRNILPLPFDFYLPDFKSCIEFDGKQHSKIVRSKEEFENIKRNDNIKNIYCIKNNIKLIRISYKDNLFKKLEKEYGNTII